MNKVLDRLKAVVAAVGILITLGYAAAQDKAISFDELEGLWLALLGLGTAVGVYAVPNKPSA